MGTMKEENAVYVTVVFGKKFHKTKEKRII
jgi:hypothetical protein